MHAISSQRSMIFALARGRCSEALLTSTRSNNARRPRSPMSWSITRGFEIFPFFPSMRKTPDQRSLVEALIFESGRPVLLLPEGATRQLPSSFDRVAVAWDHSRPAARAVADALPMLQAAKQVHVVTVVDEKRLHRPDSGVELCKHLARHGVEVTFDKVSAKGRAIGDAFEGVCGRAQHRLAGDGRLWTFEAAGVHSWWSDQANADPSLHLDAGLALAVEPQQVVPG